MTLQHILHELLAYLRTLNWSPHTIESTRSACMLFLNWLESSHGVTTPNDLRPDHLHSYQKALSNHLTFRGLPLKPSAVNSRIKALRRFLRHLYEHGHTTRELNNQIKYIKEPQILPSVLTHPQVKKLLRHIDTSNHEGIRDRAAIELLYSSGIRIGELETLMLEDVDLDAGIAKVTGKGDKERLVPIGKTALKYLTNYIMAARPFPAQQNPAAPRNLFLTTQGNPFRGSALRQRLSRYTSLAGIEARISPHTFRRSCTTEMIKSNANLYHVKELLGHESFNTLKHYTKLHIGDLKKTHAKCHPRERDEA